MKTVHYSCRSGIDMVPKKDQDELRRRLMEAFGNPSYAGYYNKTADYKNIPYHVKLDIDNIFRDFGVDPEKAWNIWETNEEETTNN
ncbi:MAG: hypothetical protein IKO33_05270 [Bacteroidaceae bacterium]|nr:hypothetical protein [Bacteroidaceae bacterium]